MARSVADEITARINELLNEQDFVIVAIDGRCASGKTTLANELQKRTDCNVIHMDDFFLRPEQRTSERLSEIGGNVDYERFNEEVLTFLKEDKAFSLRPFDCHTQDFKPEISVNPNRITVVEGSYSCHKYFGEYYDFSIFLDVEKDLQLERIKNRNGAEALQMFKDKWIPLEEKYFNTKDVVWRKYE